MLWLHPAGQVSQLVGHSICGMLYPNLSYFAFCATRIWF